MLTAEQMDGLLAEWKMLSVQQKSAALAAFFKEYGEHADWEE